MRVREAIARGWRAAVAWLRVETPSQPRLTAWAWAADIILALLLAAGAINATTEPHYAGGDVPLRIQFSVQRPEPPIQGAPPAPVPFDPYDPADPYGFQRLAPRDDEQGPARPLLVVAALTALPLATRRRYPLASFLVIAVCAMRIYRLDTDPTWTVVASVVAAYSAPMYSRYRNLALASVVLAAALVVGFNRDNLPGLPSGLVTFLLLSSVGLAANAIHTWRQRARTLQREQEAATRLAVDRERARLARELHDVVTHNVSVMVVQAGAARKVMDTSPDMAKEALLAVEAGGRAAMTELRQAIGLLTLDNDGTDLAPQPGLDQLPDLVARVRETGVPVELTVPPGRSAGTVPPGVGLAAYRVVQEALTNAVKHAAGSSVRVTVSAAGGVLRVEVLDDGGATAGGHGSGRGLIGLRERLAVYGGTLTAGPRPTGGFRVVAQIPLTENTERDDT
ncbi:sensor histidine kinase [Dactylosporangium sp. NPDC051484]|uniref:sensor histidine kinase n=1 Tax=Dactylosporangium sp. NPDC051484 TaxID=3154942 RepID=UPI00344FB3F0